VFILEDNLATVFDFNTHLTERCGRLGKVQKQKLLYAIYRLGILKHGVEPFAGTVVAWPLGPVFLEVWKQPNAEGFPAMLTASDRALAETVIQQLGAMSGRALAERSHRLYLEWKVARLGLRPTECGNSRLTPEIISKVAACGSPGHRRPKDSGLSAR